MEPAPILEEIHVVCQTLSMVAGHDIRKIAEAAKAEHAGSRLGAVRLPARKVKAARKVA